MVPILHSGVNWAESTLGMNPINEVESSLQNFYTVRLVPMFFSSNTFVAGKGLNLCCNDPSDMLVQYRAVYGLSIV
jgi:hypothetical protein